MGASFRSLAFWVVVLGFSLPSAAASDPDDFRRAFPIVEPDSEHTKIRLAREGLEAIQRITNPIAVVAVIGPYRSGKSFLLNQLLSLSCDEGFGVGHMRDTKTKGMWVWGTPVELDVDGTKVSILYLDTEGFESVGKSNVYDDRIFALATVMSSVLIYNLPETYLLICCFLEIRVKGQDVAFEPAKLLWLIQRDFLQGKSVQEMVNEALRRVPNNNGDRNIDHVNQIRDSLAIMGDNSTAFSLPQLNMDPKLHNLGSISAKPHLQRTKLCDMKDSELDQLYVEKREQLKQLVATIIRPKIIQGKPLNGNEFVAFLEQILEALNKGEIPSTGSIVEVFNKVILERCLKLYSQRMDIVRLPIQENRLQEVHEESKAEAKKLFDQQRFGQHHAEQSVVKLDDEIQKVYRTFLLENEYQSSKLCEAKYTECEDKMDHLQVMRLPSMAKFNASFLQCNETFERQCVGPSKELYKQKMIKMLGKSRSLFIKDYNDRLSNWLVIFSLTVAIVGRFIIKFFLLEIAGWAMFIFLETYARMFWSSESLWATPIGILLLVLLLYWRCCGSRKPGSHWLLPLFNNRHRDGDSRPRSD
ncbi:GTP binding protein [Musa troglodytarum]|uniref:GTP binding protein n=1 Tax=Musa troglodytarum TaxID=320322 RepID=A0A9E7FJ90_9LILI|nr:GTP binding protein [Musa troglodytarum]